MSAPHVPLAVATRGHFVESVHCGSIAVVDREGRLRFAAGDPHALAFTRSTLKPMQAIPLVAGGGVERFGFSVEQTALMCASHSGEPMHVERVDDMLDRIGCGVGDLRCGRQAPLAYAVRGECPPPAAEFSALHHNCSGKHAGMLAYCKACDHPIDTYLLPDHPLQLEIKRAVAHFTGVNEAALASGTDGCSAPNYAVPLSGLARAYARLADPVSDPEYGTASSRVYQAMTTHPEMVSGTGRNDLAFMQAGRGDWLTKVGAEGVQAIGIRSLGLGIAIKVADGAARALHPATVATLGRLVALDAAQRAVLEPWREDAIVNYAGIRTGTITPVVELAAYA